VLSSATDRFGGSVDGWMIRLDSRGDVLWQKRYGTDAQEQFFDVAVDGDGFLAIGMTGTATERNRGIYLVRTDLDGNVMWVETLLGNERVLGSAVHAVDSGWVLAAVRYKASGQPGSQGVLVRLDAAGQPIGRVDFDWSREDVLRAVLSDVNGTVTVAGMSANQSGFLLARTELPVSDAATRKQEINVNAADTAIVDLESQMMETPATLTVRRIAVESTPLKK
jgi:hypothetical protein